MDPYFEGFLLSPMVERARAGDPGAFEDLVEWFRDPLLSYAEALLRDRGHAEDAVQEALLHAWERISTLRDATLVRPWLYAILENAAFTGVRHRRSRPAVPLYEGEAIAEGETALVVDPEPVEPEEAIPVAPVDGVLRRSMAALPSGYRRALRLHYMEGRSTREVGEVLGISWNNARVRLYRARGALRRELARRGVTEESPRGARS